MSLKEKDIQIKELEKIIDYIKDDLYNIDFCGGEYGHNSLCEEYIKVNLDEGCIVCKMIYEYKKKYK